ncbi:uncharacterized protein LOC128229881 isoform X2 [Mya arenaria]|uniref:uncharacterized protein LOC128229881 isoform X2 n=1 Tax=Mya arenaria TaxID=6604 RepID=UPI0022E7CB54|nr:uncharacterized protein LOC128229881 isoform X2 [Mya arenaria]
MATFYQYVVSTKISTWLTSDGGRMESVEQRMEVAAVEMGRGIHIEQEQYRPRIQAPPEPSREQTFLDGCCNNSLFHPFIDIDASFTHGAHLITGYGILLTLFRWVIGLWTVITLPAICCISGIYCIVKAVKETVFWIVVLLIHHKPVELSDKGFHRYHVYLLTDFLATVALIATGIGLEAGIGLNGCAYRNESLVWRLAVFCMSMDAFIPHIAIVLSVLALMCLCFTVASCSDDD